MKVRALRVALYAAACAVLLFTAICVDYVHLSKRNATPVPNAEVDLSEWHTAPMFLLPDALHRQRVPAPPVIPTLVLDNAGVIVSSYDMIGCNLEVRATLDVQRHIVLICSGEASGDFINRLVGARLCGIVRCRYANWAEKVEKRLGFTILPTKSACSDCTYRILIFNWGAQLEHYWVIAWEMSDMGYCGVSYYKRAGEPTGKKKYWGNLERLRAPEFGRGINALVLLAAVEMAKLRLQGGEM